MIKNEQEWLESRQQGVGSSDSPVLALKEVFKKTPVDLYINKVSQIEQDTSDNYHFRRGHTYEPLAIKLAEEQLGKKIYAPKNNEERWNDFKVVDPTHPYIYADFDGLREDGWVVEVKSPMQRVADQIKAKGLKDYYQVQGQHLVHVASEGVLPHLGKLPDGCPGVCFIIYECETVSIQIYEIPRNDKMIQAIIDNADEFWNEHVLKKVPPMDFIETSMEIDPVKAEYEIIKGEAWEEAERQYLLATEAAAAAELRLRSAKERIKTAMDAADLKKIITEKGHKFSNIKQSGRTSFDKKALKADYPNIDLTKYDKKGEPFVAFRHYGPKDEAKYGDETLDGQLLTLKDELERFGRGKIDLDVAVDIFDELRNRTELYSRMLSLELQGIEDGMTKAFNQMRAITRTKKEEVE